MTLHPIALVCAAESVVVLKGAGYIDRLRIRIVDGSGGHGASLREFQGEFRGLSGPEGGPPPALLGTASFAPAPHVIGDGDESELVLVAGAIDRDRPEPPAFALRHDGRPEHTVAMLRASFQASLRPRGGRAIPTAVFSIADALLTRQLDPSPRSKPSREERLNRGPDVHLRHRLRGAVAPGERNLETPYGRFAVAGNPIKIQAPAQAGAASARDADFTAGLPLTGTTVRIETEWDRFTAFEIRASISHYTLALADAQGGTDGEAVWSRLDFNGTEVAFVFARLRREGLDATPRNARGVVEIGGPASRADSARAMLRVPVDIALDGACLKARRTSDLLALEFQFAFLALQIRDGIPVIVQSLRGGRGGTGPARQAEQGPPRTFDDRARLTVTFPPQHVAERAYLRQLNEGVELPEPAPEVAGQLKLAEEALRWRTLSLQDRVAARKVARQAIVDKVGGDYGRLVETLAALDAARGDWERTFGGSEVAKALKARWEKLPADQKVYVASDPPLIDPDARATIFAAWKARRLEDRRRAGSDTFPDVVRQVPSGALDPDLARTLLRIEAARLGRNELDPDSLPGVSRLVAERERQDEAFKQARIVQDALFQVLDGSGAAPDPVTRAARDWIERRLGTPGAPKDGAAWASLGPIGENGALRPSLRPFRGREHLQALQPTLAEPAAIALAIWVSFLVRVLAGLTEERESFDEVTPALLSGPSRLVFHVDGGYPPPLDEDGPEGGARPRAVEIAFSLAGLTQWGRFDLAVARRAQRLYRAGGGPLGRPDLRQLDGDAAGILAFQGIPPKRSIAGRLRDVREAAAKRPGSDETAIELPFRLTLSPSQEGRFRTPHPVPARVFDATLPPDGTQGRMESLWSAALETGVGNPEVRAIDSPDFRPDMFVDKGRVPERGPWAPWATLPDPRTGERPRFRTGLDAYDRHELVGLTSVHGMPVLGRFNASNQIVDPSQFLPPADYRLAGLSVLKDVGDQSAIYRPRALDVAELRLTSLGGSLNVATDFVPPVAALDRSNEGLFPSFTIERWRQRTALGRDIEVEVVYKGYLYPLGVRASLVKLTERRFVRHADPDDPKRLRYTAFLIQRLFVRVGRRRKDFPAMGQPSAGRRFPCRELTMLTVQTSDLLDPNADAVPPPAGDALGAAAPRPSGLVAVHEKRKRLPGLAFWPRTAPGSTGSVEFEFEIDGQAGAVRMPLLFVDNAAANDRGVLEAHQRYYNETAVDEPAAARRIAMIPTAQDADASIRSRASPRSTGPLTHLEFSTPSQRLDENSRTEPKVVFNDRWYESRAPALRRRDHGRGLHARDRALGPARRGPSGQPPGRGEVRRPTPETSWMDLAEFTDDDLGPGGKFVTRWGADPIRAAPKALGPFMSALAFKDLGAARAPASEHGPAHVEAVDMPVHPDAKVVEAGRAAGEPGAWRSETLKVDLVTYEPRFDVDRERWFVDVALNPGAFDGLVEPFVRFGLVHYQEHAIEGFRASAPVSAWGQVMPRRGVKVWREQDGTASGASIRVQVTGPCAARRDETGKPRLPRLRMALAEKRMLSGLATEIQHCWHEVGRGPTDSRTTDQGDAWCATLTVDAPQGELFVLIEEDEQFAPTDDLPISPEDGTSAAPTPRFSGPRFTAKVKVPR